MSSRIDPIDVVSKGELPVELGQIPCVHCGYLFEYRAVVRFTSWGEMHPVCWVKVTAFAVAGFPRDRSDE